MNAFVRLHLTAISWTKNLIFKKNRLILSCLNQKSIELTFYSHAQKSISFFVWQDQNQMSEISLGISKKLPLRKSRPYRYKTMKMGLTN